MKKKKPTLTHYTKKLKKVRLARTVTVIATLFVSGVVVAANVLPQVIKSSAASPTDHTNDVIAGGVDQYSGPNAKAQIIQKVFRDTSDQGQSAKALYTKLGITEAMIQGAKFEWMYGPNNTQPKQPVWESIVPYGNWRSFGRSNGPGFVLLQVAYGSKTANFYHKQFSVMFPNTWPSGTSAMPVLRDPSSNPKWFVALSCGNPVVPQIPSNPTATVSKVISTVSRGGRTVDHKAAGFKLLVGDRITYRLSAKNGSVTYPAGFQVGDGVPVGTKFISQGSSWPAGISFVNPIPVSNGQQYPTWRFTAAMAPNQIVNFDMVVEVTSAASGQVCNFAIWVNAPGQPLAGATPKVCLPVQVNKPALDIKKVKATNTASSVKVGDSITYNIEMTNTGTAAAPNAIAIDSINKNSAGQLTQSFASLGAAKVTKISDGSTLNVPTNAIKDAASQRQYANGNPVVYGYHIPSLPAGAKISFTITVKAVIIPAACDFAVANYQDSGNPLAIDTAPEVCIPVIDENKPRITVEKKLQPGKDKVSRGEKVNYTVIVRNLSTKAAQTSEITVTDTFDPTGYAKSIKLDKTSASFTGASIKTTQNANGFVSKIARMPANSAVVYEVSTVVSDTAEEGKEFCNNARITMTPGNAVASETSSTVCSTITLIKRSKAAKYINRSEDPQQSPARAGDEIQYTLTTTNQASNVASAYIVTEELADVLNYADVTSNGGGTLTGTKLIWPAKDIPAGKSITNTFTVKVKNPIPNNLPSEGNPTNFDYNMFNSYGNEVNIKIEKPLIQRVVDVASNLPETGAASYLLIVLFLGLSVYFFVRNRQLTSELAAATVEYQHQESGGSLAQAQTMVHPEEDTTNQEPPATPPAAA